MSSWYTACSIIYVLSNQFTFKRFDIRIGAWSRKGRQALNCNLFSAFSGCPISIKISCLLPWDIISEIHCSTKSVFLNNDKILCGGKGTKKIDLKSSLLNYFRFKIYLMNSNRLKNIQSKRRSCYC